MIRRFFIPIVFLLFSCEQNDQPVSDYEVLDNFSIIDITGKTYELNSVLQEHDYLLLFGFATWCQWAKKSVPQLQSLDSIYPGEFQIIGIEGDQTFNEDKIAEFISTCKIDFPIAVRVNNPVLTYIMYPDSSLSFPSFILVDSRRRVKYRQKGYLENTLDSIVKYAW